MDRQLAFALAVVTLLSIGAVVFVAGSLDRPRPPEFAPSPTNPVELGRVLIGPRLTTVDATHERDWRFFDFSRGSAVERPGPLECADECLG